jgi:hypothetical protein
MTGKILDKKMVLKSWKISKMRDWLKKEPLFLIRDTVWKIRLKFIIIEKIIMMD